MHNGAIVVDGTETFTITRSAAGGADCEFELILAPGGSGPPVHTHDDPETFEVISGSIVFSLDGVERTFTAGDRYVIPAGCRHTFRNASKTEPVHAKGVHSGRFERLIDQLAAGGPKFLRLARYLHEVDPRASYMVSPIVRATLAIAAMLGRVRGVQIAAPTGAYGR